MYQANYKLYQLKHNEESKKLLFLPLSELKRLCQGVDPNDYELIYSGELQEGEGLEDLYYRFNVDHPSDFKGHSISVSDVIVISRGGCRIAYYCDRIGFVIIPEFNISKK